jgi:hypothetical protein
MSTGPPVRRAPPPGSFPGTTSAETTRAEAGTCSAAGLAGIHITQPSTRIAVCPPPAATTVTTMVR